MTGWRRSEKGHIGRQGGSGMITYKVFLKDYELKKEDLIGVLVERRKDLRGRTQIESGLKWAKLTFGHLVEDRHAIFIVPDKFKSVEVF